MLWELASEHPSLIEPSQRELGGLRLKLLQEIPKTGENKRKLWSIYQRLLLIGRRHQLGVDDRVLVSARDESKLARDFAAWSREFHDNNSCLLDRVIDEWEWATLYTYTEFELQNAFGRASANDCWENIVRHEPMARKDFPAL